MTQTAGPDGGRSETEWTRRRFLRVGGVSIVGLTVLGTAGASCSDDEGATGSTSEPQRSTTSSGSSATTTSTTDAADGGPDLTAEDFAELGTCVLVPEKTAGPFPLDEQLDRRDITEGYDGHPVRLGLRVVDGLCDPVPGAAVEIWHTDASGDYSAFVDDGGGKDEGPGTTFLRGTQTANDAGIVEFLTIYPGWYRGRAIHIHLRVHVDQSPVLTSQLFFDESYTEQVYVDEPYAEFGAPDTTNASDGIAGDPTSGGTLLTLRAAETTNGHGTLALLNLGIDPQLT